MDQRRGFVVVCFFSLVFFLLWKSLINLHRIRPDYNTTLFTERFVINPRQRLVYSITPKKFRYVSRRVVLLNAFVRIMDYFDNSASFRYGVQLLEEKRFGQFIVYFIMYTIHCLHIGFNFTPDAYLMMETNLTGRWVHVLRIDRKSSIL